MEKKNIKDMNRRDVLKSSAAALGTAILANEPLEASPQHPAVHPPGAPVTPPVVHPPSLPVTPTVPTLPVVTPSVLENRIKQQLEQDYRQKLGVAVLPQEVQSGIDVAARLGAQRATQRNLEVEASKIGRSFYQPTSINQLIASKLTQAKDGVKLVSQSVDLNEILVENAKMLRKKWQALVDAGFTEAQSFELIKAEVEGKAARRGNV
jgi:hypothetical protein